MKKHLFTVAVACAITAASFAQPSQRQMMEGVVTVESVDPAARSVVVRSPKGRTVVQLPPDANVDQIQTGARYRVRYSEPVAVAISPGASTSASGGASAAVKPGRGGTEGVGVKAEEISGVVEAIDPAGPRITVRRLDGGTQTLALASDTQVAGPIKPGDAVTVAYQQAIATHMVSTPQPEVDPAPAP